MGKFLVSGSFSGRTVPLCAFWRNDFETDVLSELSLLRGTGEEFEQSIALVEELAFSRLHIFRYSQRDGTPAAKMGSQVRGPIAQERSRRMHALAADLEHRFNTGLVGGTADVLWETAEDHGETLRWSGLTPNYVRVTATTMSDVDLLNVVTPTEITEVVPGGVVGRIQTR